MNRRARNPGLSDFYHDMNKHGTASYWKVGGPFVVEVQRFRSSGAWLTVWRAVDHPTREGYVNPEGENRYAWDAVGRKEYTEPHYAESQAAAFGSSEGRVKEFCAKHPYEGPRTPHLSEA